MHEGVGLGAGSWLENNIGREVGDGSSTLFWRDQWLDGVPFNVRFRRLYQLNDNKLTALADVFFRLGVNGE